MGINQFPDPQDKYIPCTSATRPPTPFPGLLIYETDTLRFYVYNGGAWKYVSGPDDPLSARVYRSTAFTLTVHATVPTQIPFNLESWDYGNHFSGGTGVYTASETGLLRIDARSSVTASAVGERFIGSIYEDGVEAFRGTDVVSTGTGRQTTECHGVVSCVAGQTYDFRMHQLTGTARSLDINSYLSYMVVSRG